MTLTLYHNPRCTKSRKTLALLRQHGVEPKIVEYLKTPPSEADIADIIQKLGLKSAREMMRTKEDAYKALGLKEVDDEDALIAAMADNPKLIERPILIHGERAAIGRPPENVLSVVD